MHTDSLGTAPAPPRPGPLVIAMPHLAADRRHSLTVEPGTTIAEMVAAALPGLLAQDRQLVRVTMGEHSIPEVNWARVRPKPCATVVIRLVPQGGSMRSILAIVVVIAAVALGQAYLAPGIVGAFGLSGAAATVATSLVGAAAGAVPSLAPNALVPLAPPASVT